MPLIRRRRGLSPITRNRLTLVSRLTRPGEVDALPLQMGQIAAEIRTVFGVDACILRAIEENSLHLLGASGVPEEFLHPVLYHPYGIAHEIVTQKRPLAIYDTGRHPTTAQFLRNNSWGFKFRSYAGAPLLIGEEPIGILGIYTTRKRRHFTQTDLEHLQIVANHAAGLLDSGRRRQIAEAEAAQVAQKLESALADVVQDSLTGLGNRLRFYQAIYERIEEDGGAFTIALLDIDNFKFFNDAFGLSVGDDVLRAVGQALQQHLPPEVIATRLGGDEFALLFPNQGRGDIATIRAGLEVDVLNRGYRPADYAMDVPLRLSVGFATFPDEERQAPTLFRTAEDRLVVDKKRRYVSLAESELEAGPGFRSLLALVDAVDSRDRYSRLHSVETARLAFTLACNLGMGDDECELVRQAALIHDVGNIAVPDRLLRLPTRLSEEDFAKIREHPILGELLVAATQELAPLAGAVRHHHEHWDGGGYPDGLVGEAIPLYARIIMVADAFSAITTDRPYRRGRPRTEALQEVQAGAGTQFDPKIVAALVTVLTDGTESATLLAPPAPAPVQSDSAGR